MDPSGQSGLRLWEKLLRAGGRPWNGGRIYQQIATKPGPAII